MKRISQEEIAKKMGISRTTVSKALNGDANISILTQEKVKKTAAELGYVVNNIGRSLVSKKTMTIGLIIPKIAHSFYSRLLEGVYKTADKSGYDIIPMVSFEDDIRERKMIRNLLSINVDGIILDISEKTKSLDVLDVISKNRIPLIFLDRALAGHGFSQIAINDYEVTREAVLYAVKQGYESLSFFGGQPDLSSGMDRLEGFKKALYESNIKIKQDWIRLGGYSKEFGYRNFMDLYNNGMLPKLIFCVSDEVAFGIYEAVNQLKLNIPRDIAVVGFGDLEISRYLTPPLTTISMPVEELAQASVDLLISEIEDIDKERTIIKLDGKLIIRASM